MLHRNTPRLGEMLGEDDWFDKMSAQGRDHLSFMHMLELHAFTDKQKAQIMAGEASTAPARIRALNKAAVPAE
jgi:hypothetical protein